MKVIFLDFDGVINSHEWYQTRMDRVDMEEIRAQYPFYELDPELIENLNFIISETGAKVVISSSWRTGRPHPKCRGAFQTRSYLSAASGFSLGTPTCCVLPLYVPPPSLPHVLLHRAFCGIPLDETVEKWASSVIAAHAGIQERYVIKHF